MQRRAVLPLLAAAPLAGAPRPLFNGKDFSGWSRYGNGLWTVEEGAIVCRSNPERPGPGYLFTAEEFTDFDLQLEFHVSSHGNSGIFIRQRLRQFGTKGDERPAHSPGDGVEVQIDYNDPKNMTGAVYNLRPPDSVRGGEERWVAMRIVCQASNVTVSVDHQVVNRYSPLAAPRGAIGLQMHGQQVHDHTARFREIRIATV